MRPSQVRIKLRTLMLLVTVLSCFLAYVGSYYRLRQRGIQEAAQYGAPGILYVSWNEISSNDDALFRLAWKDQQARRRFFWPLILVDMLFGGPRPFNGTLRLSR